MFGKKKQENKIIIKPRISYDGKNVVAINTDSNRVVEEVDMLVEQGYELLGLDYGWGYAILKKPKGITKVMECKDK